ncbi:MAG: LysM peptidoglycan-binding domain-containing protein [Chloroflexota bacterium]|nr:LysM peptidoglycan-binding domain-containing protein [Chloroflexota bacterium]
MQQFLQTRRFVHRVGLRAVLMLLVGSLLVPGAVLAAPAQTVRANNYNCVAYHPVQRGQTLTAIANYYGVGLHTLAQVNGIRNANHIYVGQRLCIPGVYVPPPPPPQPQPQPGNFYYHTVQRGETLSRIAAYYGVSVPYLMQINGLYNPNRIEVGQVLIVAVVPSPQPPPQPTPQPPPPPVDAWRGAYYNNRDLQDNPLYERTDSALNFNWGTGNPGNLSNDNFSVRWTRTTYFNAGAYRFFATVDDGIRVYVDDKLIIDAFRVQPATNLFGDIALTPGYHTVRVEYFEESGVASIAVNWSRLY